MSEAAGAQPAARGRGPKGTFGDMVRTTLILAVVIVVIVFLAKDRKDTTAVKRVDSQVQLTVTQARRDAPYPLVAPAGLPQKWAPTSVSFTKDVLHIGYVAPSGKYADLEESNASVAPLLAPYAGSGLKSLGTIPVGAYQAEVQVASNGTVTLTETRGTVVVGVTGGASQTELVTLLTSLG